MKNIWQQFTNGFVTDQQFIGRVSSRLGNGGYGVDILGGGVMRADSNEIYDIGDPVFIVNQKITGKAPELMQIELTIY